jgi:hypothetical protein
MSRWTRSEQRNAVILEIKEYQENIKFSKISSIIKKKSWRMLKKNVKNLIKIRANKNGLKQFFLSTRYPSPSIMVDRWLARLPPTFRKLRYHSKWHTGPFYKTGSSSSGNRRRYQSLIANLKDLTNLLNHFCSVMASHNEDRIILHCFKTFFTVSLLVFRWVI